VDDGDAEVAWILAMGMACFSVVDDGAPSTDGLTMHASLEPSSLTTGMVVLSTTCVRDIGRCNQSTDATRTWEGQG